MNKKLEESTDFIPCYYFVLTLTQCLIVFQNNNEWSREQKKNEILNYDDKK